MVALLLLTKMETLFTPTEVVRKQKIILFIMLGMDYVKHMILLRLRFFLEMTVLKQEQMVITVYPYLAVHR